MTAEQPSAATENPFAFLLPHKYALLKTFRKSGAEVATPVWFAFDSGKLYIVTEGNSGKMKRIRNTPHVILAPCDRAGKVLGPEVTGQARELPAPEYERANAFLAHKYGFIYQIFAFVMRLRKSFNRTFIEIQPE